MAYCVPPYEKVGDTSAVSPKSSEIKYPISIHIQLRHWLNTKQTGNGKRSGSGPSFLKTYSPAASNVTQTQDKCAVDCNMLGRKLLNLTLKPNP